MDDKVYKNFFKIGLTTILIFTPLARGAVRIWSITPVLLFVAILTFLWLYRLNIAEQSTKLQRTALDIPILIFSMLAVISFIFSIYKHASFLALLRLFSYVGIYYLVVNNCNRAMKRYLITLVICIGTGLSVYGLLQYFGILPHSWWQPRNFLAATYVNHNHFAGYLELVIPVTIGALIRYGPQRTTLRLAFIGALIAMIVAFIFAQSRGGWICLSFSLVLMNIVLIKNKIVSKKSIAITGLIIVLVFSFAYGKSKFVSERIDTLLQITKGEASPETRIKIWHGTIDMVRNQPLIGTGIGTFVWGFPRYRPEGLGARAHYAHNDYLHMAAEMGIFAPIFMLWLLVLVIKNGLGSHRTEQAEQSHQQVNTVILGCAIGMLSLSLHGLIDFNFHIPANMILFVIYAAIIMGEEGTGE